MIRRSSLGWRLVAWVIGVLWIFPVAWTLLTSFKTEQDASAQTLHQGLTLARYSEVLAGFNRRKRRPQPAGADDRYQHHIRVGQAGDLAQTDFSRENSRPVIECFS